MPTTTMRWARCSSGSEAACGGRTEDEGVLHEVVQDPETHHEHAELREPGHGRGALDIRVARIRHRHLPLGSIANEH